MYDQKEPYGWKSYDNQQYSNQPFNRTPPGGQPSQDPRRPEKKGGILKKAALITAGALLFGTVSGGVMAGINIAASRYLGPAVASAEPESRLPESNAPADEKGGENKVQQDQGVQPMPNIQRAPMTDVSDIVEAAMPSVVAITSTTVYQSNNYGYGWFFGGGGAPQTMRFPAAVPALLSGRMRKSF